MAIDRAALAVSLEATLTRYQTELVEGDIKPDYSIDGQSVQWVKYRTWLLDEIVRLSDLIDSLGEDDGGITVAETQMWT